MKTIAQNPGFLVACSTVALAYGHGEAINVNVVDGQLDVTGGVLDEVGFAERMFLEDDEDGDPSG